MLLLIDGNSLVWRAAFSGGEHNIAGGIIAFSNDLISKFFPTSLAFCWDFGKSRYRSNIYPQYKATREKDAKLDIQDIYKQVDIFRKYLSNLGVQQFRVSGVEADDLLSWVSEYTTKFLGLKTVIVSTDRDLWQLVNSEISVYDPIRDITATPYNVKHLLGIDPNRIPEYKALAGDSSDNIKGIKGIGEKLAVNLLEEYGSLWQAREPEAVKLLSKSKKTIKIFQFEDDFERDLLLTRLPDLASLLWYLSPLERQELKEQLILPNPDGLSARVAADGFGKTLRLNANMMQLDYSSLVPDFPESEPFSSWPDLDNSIATCARCPLRACTGDHGPTLPDGFSTAEIMIVGRNPGKEELAQGKPFVGPSGALLEQLLDECGLTRPEVYITNVCKCYSEDNRAPTLGEIGSCQKFLQAEVDLLKPKLVIVLGNEAMASFTSWQAGVTSHCGQILKPEESPIKHEAWVAVCVHPASALRNPKNMTNFEYAVTQIKRFLEKRRAKIQSA